MVLKDENKIYSSYLDGNKHKFTYDHENGLTTLVNDTAFTVRFRNNTTSNFKENKQMQEQFHKYQQKERKDKLSIKGKSSYGPQR